MLDLTQALTYSAALGIAAAIPGPGMAALVARSVSGGTSPGFCMLAGLILGDLSYLSFAVFGLAMLAEHFNALFQLVRWGAAAYLCYLAWQFWFANHQAIEAGKPAQRKELLSAAISGVTITLGPVHANNGLANTPFRSSGKECVAPLGRSKQATRDAARRPERAVPLLLKID